MIAFMKLCRYPRVVHLLAVIDDKLYQKVYMGPSVPATPLLQSPSPPFCPPSVVLRLRAPQPQPPKSLRRPTPQARSSMSTFASQGSSTPSGSRMPPARSSSLSLASTRRVAPPLPIPPATPPTSPPVLATARTFVQSTTTIDSDRSSTPAQSITTAGSGSAGAVRRALRRERSRARFDATEADTDTDSGTETPEHRLA